MSPIHASNRKDDGMKNPGDSPPEDRNLTPLDHEELPAEFEEQTLLMADHFERVAASSAAALRVFSDTILAFAQRECCGRLEVANPMTFDKPAPSRPEPPQLEQLRRANSERARLWHERDGIAEWNVADWSNAAAGEMGEVCGAAKDLRALETATDQSLVSRHLVDACRSRLSDEIADTILYLALLAESQGIDLWDALVAKFDDVSRRFGFTQTLHTDEAPDA